MPTSSNGAERRKPVTREQFLARDFDSFDRFMREAPKSLPLSLDGDCYCGGMGGNHHQDCPLKNG